jgi:hypothetical protein
LAKPALHSAWFFSAVLINAELIQPLDDMGLAPPGFLGRDIFPFGILVHLSSEMSMSDCFAAAPEFIDEDNRRFRHWNPVTKLQMTAKHGTLLPEALVRGKTVLDLGCCLGATGHWCLFHGASHYTGVEFQPEYAEGARRLLNRYHPDKTVIHQTSIEKFLSHPGTAPFDIVCLLGVIYVFTDYYSILKSSAALAKSTIVIEGGHANPDPEFCGVKFRDKQPVNLATIKGSFSGRGTKISPKGLEWLMEEFGFVSREGLLYPPVVPDVPDIYHRPPEEWGTQHAHYLMRFERTGVSAQSVSDDLQQGKGKVKLWSID